MADDSLADVYGGPLEDGTSLFQYFEQGLRKNPHGPAVITMHQPAHHLAELTVQAGGGQLQNEHKSNGDTDPGCLTWTYTQLHEAALKFTAGLKAHGIEPGMKFATFIPNRVEWQLTLWMSTLLRLTLCSVDPGTASEEARKEERKSFLTRLDPDVIMVPNADAAANVDAAISSLGKSQPKVKIVLEGDAPETWMTLTELGKSTPPMSTEETAAILHGARNDDPDRVCAILFTSGTSAGQPKGCPRTVAGETHKQFTHYFGAFHGGTRALSSSANFRIIAMNLHPLVWKAGGSVVVPAPGTGSKGVLEAIERFRTTALIFIPALFNDYANELKSSGRDLDVSCVENVIFGGDMVTRDHMLNAVKEFPQAEVINIHGLTEGGGLFEWAFTETAVQDIPYFLEICPAGKAAKDVRIRIRDAESGKVVGRGETGELVLSSVTIIKNYLDDEHKHSFLYEDGIRWFRTGDMAMMDEDGLVYVLGRVKDRVKRAGVPIEPAALEGCVSALTGSTTSLIGWPHAEMGEAPLIIVENLNGKMVEEVKEEVLKKFGREYALEYVVTFEQLGMQKWSINATGKILKTELRSKVEEFFDSQQGKLT